MQFCFLFHPVSNLKYLQDSAVENQGDSYTIEIAKWIHGNPEIYSTWAQMSHVALESQGYDPLGYGLCCAPASYNRR